MILLFDSQSRRVREFTSYDAVTHHFNKIETLKSLEPGGREEWWAFAYYSHRRLSALLEHLKDSHVTALEREAYETDHDLIEIYTGSGDGHGGDQPRRLEERVVFPVRPIFWAYPL